MNALIFLVIAYILLVIASILPLCPALPAIEVSLNYGNGRFAVTNITELDLEYIPDMALDEAIYETQKEYGAAEGYYKFSVMAGNGELYSFHGQYPPVMFYDYLDESGNMTGGAIELDNVNNTYLLPFAPNATALQIEDGDGNKIYRAELSEFLPGLASGTGTGAGGGSVGPEPTPAELKGAPFPWFWVIVTALAIVVALILWGSFTKK